MPNNNEDWNEIVNTGEFDLELDKWKPITIQYGYKNISGVIFFYWRVKETQHTFSIKLSQLNELSKGDVPQHIQDFLQDFRKEFISWCIGGLKEPWMRDYYEQYKSYIEF